MDIFSVLTATWPAAETRRVGPWTVRRGDGGGRRVMAATLDGPMGELGAAEAAMRAFGQPPFFMIRPGEEALDQMLAEMGYAATDATGLRMGVAADLAGEGPDWSVIRCDAPLACMVEIWAASGTGQTRLAIMDRACGPKVWLMARDGDRPAGCAFVAISEGVAMMHSLAIAPEARRRGLGLRMTRAAAAWGAAMGAEHLALAVVRDNGAAVALYDRVGLPEIAGYHFRRGI